MKLQKLLMLLTLFAFAPVVVQAQDPVEVPKATVVEEAPVAVVPEPVVVTVPDAVVTAASPDQAPTGVEAIVLEVFLGLVQKFPWLATLIVFMGMCRVFAKPAFSLIHSLVDLTPSKHDDGILNGALLFFTTHPAGKAIAFGIDWLTSIKIKAPTK